MPGRMSPYTATDVYFLKITDSIDFNKVSEIFRASSASKEMGNCIDVPAGRYVLAAASVGSSDEQGRPIYTTVLFPEEEVMKSAVNLTHGDMKGLGLFEFSSARMTKNRPPDKVQVNTNRLVLRSMVGSAYVNKAAYLGLVK